MMCYWLPPSQNKPVHILFSSESESRKTDCDRSQQEGLRMGCVMPREGRGKENLQTKTQFLGEGRILHGLNSVGKVRPLVNYKKSQFGGGGSQKLANFPKLSFSLRNLPSLEATSRVSIDGHTVGTVVKASQNTPESPLLARRYLCPPTFR